MGSRLGCRIVHFANLPIKLLMPSPPFESIREIALKTIPSATKTEIRRVRIPIWLPDRRRTHPQYGRQEEKTRPFLAGKPDYKKAYVTLRSPLSLNPTLFPIPWIKEERDRIAQSSMARSRKSSVVEESKGNEGRSHWLDDPERREREELADRRRYPASRRNGDLGQRSRRGGREREARKKEEASKFPWSNMRKWS